VPTPTYPVFGMQTKTRAPTGSFFRVFENQSPPPAEMKP
jgi:hypothetical protein